MRPSRILPALLVATVLAVGCSDSGSSTSKEDFVEGATEICDETRARIDEASEGVDPANTDQLNELVVTVSEEFLSQVDDIRGLGFPDGDEAALAGAFATYEESFEIWKENPSALTAGLNSESFVQASTTLEDYGLESCSASFTNP